MPITGLTAEVLALDEMLFRVLEAIAGTPGLDIDGLAKSSHIDRGTLISSVKVLKEEKYVHFTAETEYDVTPTKEGLSYSKWFPEEELLETLHKSGGEIPLSEIKSQIGLIWAKKNGWVEISSGKVKSVGSAANKKYIQREVLDDLLSKNKSRVADAVKTHSDVVKVLESRKLVVVGSTEVISSIQITEKGKDAISDGHHKKGEIAELSREIISRREWVGRGFRKYDINAVVEGVYPARRHPVTEFIDIVRETWLRMGFVEIEGPMVESAFWNFDALFVPQDHPARDKQDTFFLKNPSSIEIDDVELKASIRSMHKKGWEMPWKEGLATQALLRTHSTAATIRHVRKIASSLKKGETARLFSIGRTFRNESIDYKHLAEFYQIDGMIIGDNLGLSNLIHTLSEFYSRLGLVMGKDIHIRPSYFPFVEPGMELYYTPGDGSSVELLGSGVIREEIAKAMGTKKSILAWGGGIDRLLLKSLKVDSIVELYKNNIGWLRNRREIEV